MKRFDIDIEHRLGFNEPRVTSLFRVKANSLEEAYIKAYDEWQEMLCLEHYSKELSQLTTLQREHAVRYFTGLFIKCEKRKDPWCETLS